ncbi:MAG: hypothetical protein ABJB12_02820 [Pseudomonadota bacterium]
MVRFAVTPPPKPARAPRAEVFAAQLALAQLHPRLAPVKPVPGGYMLDAELTRTWFELPARRGFAGYGLARALRILLDVLSGLAALHDTKTEAGTGFVHGEVVPAMLRVDRQGCGRLIPLAPWHRLEAGAPAAAERQGHLAPERLLGDAIDQRADVFSCGVLLWEALAGRRLFEDESVDGIVTRLMGGKVQLPDLPPELAWAAPLKSVVMCALSVDPSQRFSDGAELAAAIEECAHEHVATHEDVAEFFGARERASMLPPALPAQAGNHNSSLSAMVAPALPREKGRASEVQRSAADAPRAPLSEPPSSAATTSSKGRRRLFAAGLLCVLSALAWAAFNRHSPTQPSASGAPSGVDLHPLPKASHAARATLPPASPVVALDGSAPTASAGTEAEPSAPRSDAGAGKPHPSAHSLKPTPPGHPRTSKPAPAHDQAADQYGI